MRRDEEELKRKRERLEVLKAEREELRRLAEGAKVRKQEEEEARAMDRRDFWKGINEIRADKGPYKDESMDLLPTTSKYLGIDGLSAHSMMASVINSERGFGHGGSVGPSDVLNIVDEGGKKGIEWIAKTVHDNTGKRLKSMFGAKDDKNPQQGAEVASNDGPGTTPARKTSPAGPRRGGGPSVA